MVLFPPSINIIFTKTNCISLTEHFHYLSYNLVLCLKSWSPKSKKMCFHTSQTKKTTNLENRFKGTLHKESLRPIFDNPEYHLNGFAHPNMLIILQEEPSVLMPGKWGIAPQNKTRDQLESYYKEAVKFGGGLNAKSEKLFNHFLYKQSATTRRCIIPVTGFYEPHDHKGNKYPFYISRNDEDSIGLAGIYTLIEG